MPFNVLNATVLQLLAGMNVHKDTASVLDQL